LARIYDDTVHLVTPATSSLRTLGELRGARVSLGDPESGVYFIAKRLLDAAGLVPDRDLRAVQLGIGESTAALAAGRIDAFFWSGSLPTQGISTLAGQLPIRLLDLADVVGPMCAAHPEYAPGTVPAGSYGIPGPVTSLLVRNVLLVGQEMPDDLAEALVKTMFATQEELTRASRAALTIDPRAAIGTQPVLLHPGAERFYRSTSNY
jgi:TRAP transporter TAXI family solute receptor